MINIANFRSSSGHPTQMYTSTWSLLEIYLIHSTNEMNKIQHLLLVYFARQEPVPSIRTV